MENTVEAIKKLIGEPRNYGRVTAVMSWLSCCFDRTYTGREGTNGGRGEKREGGWFVR